MRRKFKFKRQRNYLIKIGLLLLLSYLTFSFVYQALYKNYIKKLNSKELIDHIIKENLPQENKNKLTLYFQPNYIIDHTLAVSLKEMEIPVMEEQEPTIKPTIYIYSTHEKEEYSNKYFEAYNITPTVTTAAYILKDYLKDFNIETVIEKGSVTDLLKQNNWSYSRSYDASKLLIENNIKANEYRLVIDLHRDASSLSNTLLDYNGKKYARILFVIGAEHEEYEKNYNVALTLNTLLNERIPSITRGISKKSGPGVNGIYNQNLSPNAVLIELGGQYNEIEEINNTLEVLAEVILSYLEGET